MQNLNDIPQQLHAPAQAALHWINQSQEQNFELTGVVDYEQAANAVGNASYELGLVLCDGELCAREQVQIQPTDTGFQFSLVGASAREIPALLDPPVGVRSGWLAGVLQKHEFVLLLFYRGLW